MRRSLQVAMALTAASVMGALAACGSFGGSSSDATPDAEADASETDAQGAGDDAKRTTSDAQPADAGDAADPDAGPKRIFMTTTTFTGNLTTIAQQGGLYDGGDGQIAGNSLCALEAQTLALPAPRTRWVAWLSTSSASAYSRYSDKGPRVSVTGAAVLAALGGQASVQIPDGHGKPPSNSPHVWTGTGQNGLVVDDKNGQPSTCGDWSEGDGVQVGAAGDPTNVMQWSNSLQDEPCGVSHPIYCIED